MINSVKATGATDPNTGRRSKRDDRPQSSAQGDEAPARPPPPQTNADLRLVIERDLERGDYVYRLVDRRTGEVVTELPRHKVDELARAATYAAGALVNTKA